MTPEEFKEMFPDAEFITVEPGDSVMCDACDKLWTDSTQSGGLLFQSKAICPDCATRYEVGAVMEGEEQFIVARCPKTMSFADWVRDVLRKE